MRPAGSYPSPCPPVLQGEHTIDEFLSYLYQALASDYGIAIAVSDRKNAMYRLKNRRKKDPAFAELQFRLSPNDENEIWIVREKPEKMPQLEAPSNAEKL